LLCLMIMPGRSWVAGIDIGKKLSLYDCGLRVRRKTGRPQVPPPAYYAKKAKALFYTELRPKRNLPQAELIEVGRNAPVLIRFAGSPKLGL
jgi:hypothetical protein